MTWEEIATTLGIMTVGGAATAGVAYHRNRRAEDKAILDRIIALETQDALLKQAVLPLSAMVQASLIDKLTHFHTPILDALLVKLGPPNTLTAAEEGEMAEALRQRETDMGPEIDAAERIAARMLPLVIQWARVERESPGAPGSLRVVEVPAKEEP